MRHWMVLVYPRQRLSQVATLSGMRSVPLCHFFNGLDLKGEDLREIGSRPARVERISRNGMASSLLFARRETVLPAGDYEPSCGH